MGRLSKEQEAERQVEDDERARRIVEKAVAAGTARPQAPMKVRFVDPASLRPAKPMTGDPQPSRHIMGVNPQSTRPDRPAVRPLDAEKPRPVQDALLDAAGLVREEDEPTPASDPGRDPGPRAAIPREETPRQPVASPTVPVYEPRTCALEECGAEFTPTHHKQRYCQPGHSKMGLSRKKNDQKKRARKRQREERENGGAPQAPDSRPAPAPTAPEAPDSSPKPEFAVPPADPTVEDRYRDLLFALCEDEKAPEALRLKSLEKLGALLS